MAIKLDMECAYDRMYWSFLKNALEDFGFYPYWIRWIMACMRLPFAIFVNGTPFDFFCSIVVYDKIVPYSHIICADALL